MSDEEIAALETRRLREVAAHMAHTLETIYGWWERGENVLDDNKEYAAEGLAMWSRLSDPTTKDAE